MRFQTLKAGIFALLQPITEVGDFIYIHRSIV
jgi:hypothetical protein